MGKIDAGFTFQSSGFWRGLYTTEDLVKRLSDSEDRIPVMVSERLVDVTQDYVGNILKFTDNSVLITATKKNEIGWCFLFLPESYGLWRKKTIPYR